MNTIGEMFDVDRSNPNALVAKGENLTVTTVGGSVFHRRAMKMEGAKRTQVNILVCRLTLPGPKDSDGKDTVQYASLYVAGNQLILTTEDLRV